jgi:hypothetical protein
MPTIALLGDSIFDNRVYVGDQPDVTTHCKNLAPTDWVIRLLAVDGSVVRMVASQASQITEEVTHLIVSAGGNDALSNADILTMTASSSAEVLEEISKRADAFRSDYAAMLEMLLKRALPLSVCSVYYPNFPESNLQRIATAALSCFNDVIISEAALRGIPLIDLRLVCTEAADYANEIEPSGPGGEKIAKAIIKLIQEHDFSKQRTEIYY